MIWIVNVNSNLCRIYHYQKSPAKVTLIKEIEHPENKLKPSEIVSDKPGRYKGGMYSPHTDIKEVEFDHFAREVAKELDEGRVKSKYEKLILIAPPHMNGLLLQHMDKHVKELVMNNIQKDLIFLKDHELLNFVKENDYPAN